MLGRLYKHRGDDDTDPGDFGTRIDLLLARYHTPGIA